MLYNILTFLPNYLYNPKIEANLEASNQHKLKVSHYKSIGYD